MPRKSQTGNVKKLCECGRSKWAGCSHPWYVDYKAQKDHERRPNERYRKNLDVACGRHAGTLREAQEEARRAITAWLDGRNPADLQPSDRPTLAQVLDVYVERPHAAKDDARRVGPLTRTTVHGRPFGEWRAAEITREALDRFRQQRRTVAGNRNLALLRAMFNWAVVGGLVSTSPFKVGTVSVVKLAREESRTRRLQAGEEIKLLAACGPGVDKRGRPWRGNPLLHDLIIALLETGCRRGELLSLQWHQVGRDLFLLGRENEGAARAPGAYLRPAPEGAGRRRNDPAGEPLPPNAYVFGDETGAAPRGD